MFDIVKIDESNIEYFKLIMDEDSALRACYEKNVIALGAVDLEKDNLIIGQIVCARGASDDDESLHIESIYVSEDYRRQGVGLELLNRALMIADSIYEYYGINVDFYIDHEYDNGLYDFFKGLDFELTESENRTYTCLIGEGSKSERIKNVSTSECKTLSSLNNYEKGKVIRNCNIEDAMKIEMGLMDEDMSVFLFNGTELEGMILVSLATGDPEITWTQISQDSNMKLISLMALMMSEGAKKYSSDQKLYIPIVDESMDKITKVMLGDSLKLIETSIHGYKAFEEDE